MSCTRSSCHCSCYKQPSSKWIKDRCNTCNHPKNDHKQDNAKVSNRASSKSVASTSYNVVNGYQYKQSPKPLVQSRIKPFTNKYPIHTTSQNFAIRQNQKNVRQTSTSVTSKIAAIKEQLNSTSSKHKTVQPNIGINKHSLSSGVCALCADTKSNIITLSKCGHKLCKECMKQYIMITALDKLNIKCPFCPEILDQYKDVKVVLSHKEFFDIYLSPNLKKCLSSNCDNTVKLMGTSAARLDCNKCKRSWCINCKVPWHENMDCDTYKKTDVNEQKTKEFLLSQNQRGLTKKCPNCNIDIEKNEGCNHMHCRSSMGCGAHFCWQCGLLQQDHGTSFPCPRIYN